MTFFDDIEKENIVLQHAKLVCEWDEQQYQLLKDCYLSGVITPTELKEIVAKRLIKILKPVRDLKIGERGNEANG